MLLLVALMFLTYLSAETIEVIRKALNPVKYLTSKIPFTVTNLSHHNEAKPEAIVEPEEDAEEDVNPSEEPEEEAQSTVVDLTDVSMLNKQEGKKAPKTSAQPSNTEGDNDGNLTVEVATEGEKATGKTLTVEEVLKTPINPKEPFLNYKYPQLDLLKKYNDEDKPQVDMEEIKANNARIVEVLNSFGVAIREIKATVGPTITLYEITPVSYTHLTLPTICSV